MDPLDGLVCLYLYDHNYIKICKGAATGGISITDLAEQMKRNVDDIEVSLRHLETLSFFDARPNTGLVDINEWSGNAIFREFMRACYPEVRMGRLATNITEILVDPADIPAS
jgi:hypothetical protein